MNDSSTSMPPDFIRCKKMGLAFQKKDEFDSAITQFHYAISTLDLGKRAHRLVVAEMRIRIGDLFQVMHQWDRAAYSAYRGLIGLNRNKGSSALKARALNILGIADWYGNGPASAIRWFSSAYDISKHNRWVPALQRVETLANLSLCLFLTGKAQQAKFFQQLALRIAKKNELSSAYDRILRQLANTYQDTGDYKLAAKLLGEIQPDEDTSSLDKLAWHNSSAMLAARQGQISSALEHFEIALEELPEFGPERLAYAAVLSGAALLMIGIGKTGAALDFANSLSELKLDAAPLSVHLGSLRVSAAMEELDGNFDNALAIWQSAIELISDSANGDAMMHLEAVTQKSEVLSKLGRNQEAIQLLEGTIIANHIESSHELPAHAGAVINILARLFIEAGEISKALELVTKSAATEITQGNIGVQLAMMANLAEIASTRKQNEGAILFGKIFADNLIKSIAGSSITRKSRETYVQAHILPLQILAERLAVQGRFSEALEISTLTKYALFTHTVCHNVELQGDAPHVSFQHQEATKLIAWRNICSEATDLQTKCHDWRTPAKKKRHATNKLKTLRSSVPDLLNQMATGYEQPTSIKTVLSPHVSVKSVEHAHIQFGFAGEQIFVEVKRGTDIFTRKLAMKPNELARRVLDFRQDIATFGGQHLELGYQLYDVLFSALEEKLDGTSQITMSLDGMLNHLPFACLFDGKKFLVERLELSNVEPFILESSPQNYAIPSKDRIIAFGSSRNPDNDQQLNFVQAELGAIQQACSNAVIVDGDEFTAERLEAELKARPKHVHIAGHFHSEPGAAHQSYIVLGDGTKLHLSEIASGPYDFSGVENVVFSACNTATMELGMNGFESLAAIALARGAQSVIGSQWPVDDLQTSEFMKCYYEAMFSGKMPVTPATALRQTQMVFVAGPNDSGLQKPHLSNAPYHWAGFSHYHAA